MALNATETTEHTANSKRVLLEQRLRQKAAAEVQECPVSPGQNALLFLHRMAPRSPAYNVAFVARVISEVNVTALERAMQRVVDRHAALRTTYQERDGDLRQVIHGAMELRLKQVDASGWSEEELVARVREAFDEPYDLEEGPVFRALLFTRSSDKHVLLFGIHHIATDGWSQGIILKELQELYQAYTEGHSADLPPLGISYAESVRRRLAMLEGEKGRKLWEYWERTLGGDLPTLDLPTDYPRPATPTMQGDSCPFKIDEDYYGRLKSLAKAEGVTFYTLVLAALQVLLMRYTGKEDILVGTPMAARNEPAFENVVGYFMNSVVIRADLSGDPTFREALKRVREGALGALSHQDLPFALLVKRLCPEREASRSPIFQVMFNLQSRQTLGPFADLLAGEDSNEPVEFGGLLLKPFHLAQGGGAFDLILELIDTGEIMDGLLMYGTDLFKKETIARMAMHFGALLEGIARDPDQRLARLPVLTEEERQHALQRWNATAADYPRQKCVHQLIWEQAEKRPSAIAVACDDNTITYGALIQRAEHLARHLRALGVEAGQLVGIYMERSIEMVVGILAVLRAGGAYVPLDPAFPPERLVLMVEDAGCVAILTQQSLVGSLPGDRAKALVIDKTEFDSIPLAGPIPAQDESADNLAYVIYTSGSTGKPKGVEIPHRALVNFVLSIQQEPGISADDILLSVTTVSFDIFGLELFVPLVAGAQTVLVRRDVASDGKKLLRALERTRATVMQGTPVTWRLLLESGWKRAPRLKALCGGEAFSRELADRILGTGAELWNMYGPTETTIWSAINRLWKDAKPITIGKPVANTQLYVLDRSMEPIPVGVPGELYIGGDGLARGYHNNHDLTLRSFVPDPFANGNGTRLYRTGDLVRRLADGSIQFIGRLDNQVKIRGYRIELGDIEHHLGQHPDVKATVVVVREDKPTLTRLVAYYVPSLGKKPSGREFREYLKGKLPDYMIPALFVPLDAFPLTPNGKVDRRSLPQPEMMESNAPSGITRPRDEIEKSVASIWESVLGRKQISILDNFFDLGGDSLVAARLFAEIERRTGQNIPLATLFHFPTIEGLADCLRAKSTQSEWSIVVPMQEKGTNPPLFLVHGAEGNVLLYRSLQHNLGSEQPVYGLQSEGLDGRADFAPTIEDMASKYIDAIKKVQAHGPYYLGGYCLGGTVALEMAQQLKRSGDQVALLTMFETYNARRMTARPGRLIDLLFSLQNLAFHALNILSIRPEDRNAFLKEKVNTELLRIQAWKDINVSRLKSLFHGGKSESYRHIQIFKLNDEANKKYLPRQYDGKITLFRPKRQFIGYMDRHYGWEGIPTGGVEMHILPFYPRGMLAEPFVGQLSQELSECIARSIGGQGAPNL